MDKYEHLSSSLRGNSIFLSDTFKILVIAPPKCASTSIFLGLHEALDDSSINYANQFSGEYIRELCIHSYRKKIQDASAENLRRVFRDPAYKKILIVRDPIMRLCSAIVSKYLLHNSPQYCAELEGAPQATLRPPTVYLSPDEFTTHFNHIAELLLTEPPANRLSRYSHSCPITACVPKEILPYFDETIDISSGKSWHALTDLLNQHFSQFSTHATIGRFPKVNDSPLRDSSRFLSLPNFRLAIAYYSEDYSNLDIAATSADQHLEKEPTLDELSSYNAFIALATRSIDLFNIGQARYSQLKQRCKHAINSADKLSELNIKCGQLTHGVELSRRAAEEFESRLCITHELLSKERLANQELQSALDKESLANQELQSALNKERLANQELQSALNKERLANQELQSALNKESLANQELQSALDKESLANQELQSAFDTASATIESQASLISTFQSYCNWCLELLRKGNLYRNKSTDIQARLSRIIRGQCFILPCLL